MSAEKLAAAEKAVNEVFDVFRWHIEEAVEAMKPIAKAVEKAYEESRPKTMKEWEAEYNKLARQYEKLYEAAEEVSASAILYKDTLRASPRALDNLDTVLDEARYGTEEDSTRPDET